MPSLASSTGTRVDSAAKHTLQCRVAEPLLREWARNNDSQDPDRFIQQNKMVYCVHKNELAMNVSTALLPNSNKSLIQTYKQNHAYPPIVSTLGCLTDLSMQMLRNQYAQVNFEGFVNQITTYENELKDNTVRDERKAALNKVVNMPYFMPMGYALTFGHPHHLLGDTMCTLLIGGMITVRNGGFEMRTGQMVQWYFDFEEDCFAATTDNNHVSGERLFFDGAVDAGDQQFQCNAANVKDGRYKRRDFQDREYSATSNGKKQKLMLNADKARMVFRIKPYVKSRRGDSRGDVYGDKIRVFAKCIGGGRAFDDVDIMLMTQSM